LSNDVKVRINSFKKYSTGDKKENILDPKLSIFNAINFI